MSLLIDRDFILRVSTRLEHFQNKGKNLYNFRCPICGDSKKNKLKARGYFFGTVNGFFFKCHNCSVSMSLGKFLKHVDNNLASEYSIEKFKESKVPSNIIERGTSKKDLEINTTTPIFKTTLKLSTIAKLNDDHKAKKYIESRKIPKQFWNDIYYAADFKDFIDRTFPNHGKKLFHKEERIVIPFYDEKKNLQGVQGRALDESKIKYITIRAKENMKKIFGLERIDFSKKIYVVEGPIDSLFLNNCIATLDSALYRVIDIVGNYNFVFIPDMQPYNKEVVRNIERCIKTDNEVALLPCDLKHKDINDLIIDGIHNQKSIMKLIENHTAKGLKANLMLSNWRKC